MEDLFEKERIARINGDIKNLEEIHQDIIKSCNSEDEIIQTLRSLVNKRKQDQNAIKKLIRSIFAVHKEVDFLKNLLNRVIEGRIFLEDERVDICEYIRTALGNKIEESYEIIKGVPIETFTTISEKKRNGFIFEQTRLALLLNHLHEADLFLRKVRKGYLDVEEKVTFINYSILLRVGQNSLIEAAKLYLELNEIEGCKKNISLGSIYCIMSTCLLEGKDINEEKKTLLKLFSENKDNDENLRVCLKTLLSDLLVDYDMLTAITDCTTRYNTEINQELVMKSFLEHNFFVISKFFSNIKIEQMALLLKISEDNLIEFISEMVNEKYSNAKINQQESIVFLGSKSWNNKVDKVLDKIVLASYMIHKQSLNE